jgi:hypothetical protein
MQRRDEEQQMGLSPIDVSFLSGFGLPHGKRHASLADRENPPQATLF